MRLMKEQSTHLVGSESQVWNGEYFESVLAALLESPDSEAARSEFQEKFFSKYHDIAVYTVLRLSYVRPQNPQLSQIGFIVTNASSETTYPSKEAPL